MGKKSQHQPLQRWVWYLGGCHERICRIPRLQNAGRWVFLVWNQYGALKITKTSTIIPFFLGPIGLKLPKKRTQMKSRLEICMEGYAKSRLDHFNLSIHSSKWFHQQPSHLFHLQVRQRVASVESVSESQQSKKSSHFLKETSRVLF